MAAVRCEEQNNLEIKTKSIEQTLVPLVNQITILVNHKEKPKNSERTLRAIVRVGQAVNLAVEKFVMVGEAIADENQEIKTAMYKACQEAKLAGCSIAKVTDIQYDENGKLKSFADKTHIVKGARDLLSAVTKVLLLADKVVIKQLLQAKDRVLASLHQLQKVVNFTEFVKTFSQFGSEMVNLAHLTGDRQTDLKEERRRAQMGVARSILEKSTMMLLTSSKTCLRHPDCQPAKQNRDNVFRQMYRAMDLITYAVTDGEDMKTGEQNSHMEDYDHHPTVQVALRHFEDTVEMTRMTLVGQSTRESLESALHFITESSQDFTDSAYTPHEHREVILQLTECVKNELSSLLQIGIKMDQLDKSSSEELEVAINRTLRASKELKKQLQNTALEQAAEIFKTSHGPEIITALKNAGIAGDSERVEDISIKFQEYIEQLQEVCRLLKHVATTNSLIINTDHVEKNIKSLGLQIIYAAKVLAIHSTSKIAKENLDVYCDAWEVQINELSSLTKDIGDACQRKIEKQGYMSLPRPGRHGTTTKPLKAVKLDVEEQAKIAKLGLEMKLITSEMDAETEKWEEPENDIVKRAKNMSSMAFSMYLFTRGEGPLKTTQDLFTQAEYFAEEANKLYKTVREFTYEVPCGTQRNELLAYLDKVPMYCQQLHFTVKNPTVGKAATFNKVDSVIQETKNLMNVIAKVVTTCFICATKYNIDYRGSVHQNWSPHNRNYQSNGDDVESIKSTHSEGTPVSKPPVISSGSAGRKHSKAHPIFEPFRI